MQQILKILLKKKLNKVIMPVDNHYWGNKNKQLKNKFFYKGISIYPFRNYNGHAEFEFSQIIFNNNIHYIRDRLFGNKLTIDYKLTYKTYKKISTYIKCNMKKRK